MSTTTIVTVLAALWVGFSAFSLLRRAEWVVKPLRDYGVLRSWWTWAAKAAGAVGLLVGLFVPVVGLLAGIGLVLYFAGAVVTVLRARSYSTVVYPLLYMGPVIAALVLGYIAWQLSRSPRRCPADEGERGPAGRVIRPAVSDGRRHDLLARPRPGPPAVAAWRGQAPVTPSRRSRTRSAWPLWRAYSAIRWT
ncbi:DoxX family protein [Nonomuraea roseola]|uniref:DoxX family protein n=1 Tax=Nonomuraea roseola TaxID=46179 RepID=A0ABV5PVI3_9ACTN